MRSFGAKTPWAEQNQVLTTMLIVAISIAVQFNAKRAGQYSPRNLPSSRGVGH
jgi:hypothetical protein